jgi:hypothetical protein
MRNACTVLFGEPEKKGLLESLEYSWKDNNKVVCERVEFVQSSIDIVHCVAFVNTDMNFWCE